MTEKILIESLPVTAEPLPIRRILQPRGELALIEDGREFQHLGYFSIKRGEGFFRGGHYHLKKTEYLYVVDGKMVLTFVDLDSEELSRIVVIGGNRIVIHPRCAHRFDAMEDARAIEYFNAKHDPQDDYPYEPLLGPLRQELRA